MTDKPGLLIPVTSRVLNVSHESSEHLASAQQLHWFGEISNKHRAPRVNPILCFLMVSSLLSHRRRLQNEDTANRWYQSADTDMVRYYKAGRPVHEIKNVIRFNGLAILAYLFDRSHSGL